MEGVVLVKPRISSEFMTDELAEVLKKFDLSSRERVEVDLNLKDVDEGRDECRKCLFGKVIGGKVVNATRIKSFVNYMWGYP